MAKKMASKGYLCSRLMDKNELFQVEVKVVFMVMRIYANETYMHIYLLRGWLSVICIYTYSYSNRDTFKQQLVKKWTTVGEGSWSGQAVTIKRAPLPPQEILAYHSLPPAPAHHLIEWTGSHGRKWLQRSAKWLCAETLFFFGAPSPSPTTST